jgi:hypothetical protein
MGLFFQTVWSKVWGMAEERVGFWSWDVGVFGVEAEVVVVCQRGCRDEEQSGRDGSCFDSRCVGKCKDDAISELGYNTEKSVDDHG